MKRYNLVSVRRVMSAKSPDGFVEWVEASKAASHRHRVAPNEAFKGKSNYTEIRTEYIEQMATRNNVWFQLSHDSDRNQEYVFDYGRDLPVEIPESRDKCNIDQLDYEAKDPLIIFGAIIRHLKLSSPLARRVYLHSCAVANLELDSEARDLSLQLTNCWLGELKLCSGGVRDLKINGGGILSVHCPAPDLENPFLGSVELGPSVYWPTDPSDTKIYHGAQGYRNLRAHLEKLENVPAANQMQSLVLKAERHHDTKLNWIVNWSYEKTCGYGQKPERPLVLLGVSYLVFVVFLWITGGAIQGMEETAYPGSRHALIKDGTLGQLQRALWLPAQAVFRPFSFLTPNKLVVAANWVWATVEVLHGLFTYAMLVLCGLSIRKRFKKR